MQKLILTTSLIGVSLVRSLVFATGILQVENTTGDAISVVAYDKNLNILAGPEYLSNKNKITLIQQYGPLVKNYSNPFAIGVFKGFTSGQPEILPVLDDDYKLLTVAPGKVAMGLSTTTIRITKDKSTMKGSFDGICFNDNHQDTCTNNFNQ